MEAKISKKLILCGAGCSGKDFLKQRFVERGYVYSVSHTTRPPRPGELNGRDYFFISDSEFVDMIRDCELREWNKFAETWYYGTSNRQFAEANLFVMTPSGISALTPEERQNSFVIYLDIPEEVRRDRLSKRKDADNAERRLNTDREDFFNFQNYDLRITNDNF